MTFSKTEEAETTAILLHLICQIWWTRLVYNGSKYKLLSYVIIYSTGMLFVKWSTLRAIQLWLMERPDLLSPLYASISEIQPSICVIVSFRFSRKWFSITCDIHQVMWRVMWHATIRVIWICITHKWRDGDCIYVLYIRYCELSFSRI